LCLLDFHASVAHHFGCTARRNKADILLLEAFCKVQEPCLVVDGKNCYELGQRCIVLLEDRCKSVPIFEEAIIHFEGRQEAVAICASRLLSFGSRELMTSSIGISRSVPHWSRKVVRSRFTDDIIRVERNDETETAD